ISTAATSAVGTGAYVGWLASLLFGMVGVGTTALVARAWGRGDRAEANVVANRSLALAAVLGAGVCCLFYFAAPHLAGFLRMQGEQYRIAVHYLQIDAFGHFFGGLSLIGAAALRGAGDTRSPMWILGLVSVTNLILSPILVFGLGPIPAFGVDGIVFGTLAARFAGGVLMIAALARGLSGLKLSPREFSLRGEVVRRILRIGIPAALDGVLIWSAQMVFLQIINSINRVQPGAFAAHIVGIQMEAITYLPAVAWGLAAATMVGQSLGAAEPRRAIRVGHEAILQCGILAAVISVAFFFGADAIYHLMQKDPNVHAAGIPAFRLNAFFQIPLVISIIYVFALRGAGDTRFPLLINVFGVVCVRLPAAYILGIEMEMGLLGAWIGMAGDVTVRAMLVWLRYVRGRWTGTAV
ncbi:MAG: MATE family efflux transporter, partial [Planctomycetes bacterium]|nr:MATE family efflux transporter [Planctomycetota bacterium]